MKHRYHLWIVGTLILGSASIVEARTWLGSNGSSYDTLKDCLKKNTTCSPQGRVIAVDNIGAVPKKVAVAARLAKGAVPPPEPIYYLRVQPGRRMPSLTEGGVTVTTVKACMDVGTNNFHSPPCSSSQIEVIVIER